MSAHDDDDEPLEDRLDALETAVLELLRIHSGKELEKFKASDLSDLIETARARGRRWTED
ncbi:MAG: hypothetical protein B7Z66_12290 [Chromatiales bacterium 21-64-14]|nr:MAG: hypothetical protein B7Z66_12290 [Chromatiales bacterium 21-64-14]HQU15499.1 hypothetical protein [Gammaproteobacteria bacterium]